MPIVILFTFNYFFISCLLDKGQFKMLDSRISLIMKYLNIVKVKLLFYFLIICIIVINAEFKAVKSSIISFKQLK